MSDFNVRSDSVDVEQIMRQIRARVREKRGSDYTEAELQQLATVKLEKFLDPRGVRSDLVEAFRKHHTVAEAPPNYEFEDTTLYESHRGLIRLFRKLFRPILKLFFNPDKITSALHIQAKVNTEYHRQLRQRDAMDPLFYEVIHNLVLEVTRVGIEVQNLKMRVESLSSRMDFDERRARIARERRGIQAGAAAAPGSSGPAGPQSAVVASGRRSERAVVRKRGVARGGPRRASRRGARRGGAARGRGREHDAVGGSGARQCWCAGTGRPARRR